MYVHVQAWEKWLMSIRVIQVGLGPIGSAVIGQMVARSGFTVVGAVDVDPSKIGHDAGLLAGIGHRLGVTVDPDISSTCMRVKADAVVLCTSSSLKQVTPQIETILRVKLPIVSTSEELSYPVTGNVRYARRIDRLAKRSKVAVLGTGVNPGFTMDALPISLTGVCERVDRIRVDRIQDASTRRLPFQKKIGCGLTRAEFRAKVLEGAVRHVGLAESISMIADALGWKIDRVTDTIKPKIASKRITSKFLTVRPGYVCGILQDGVGYRAGRVAIKLHMEAYLGAPESYDSVSITGSPKIAMKISGGVPGDIATASIAVNSIPKVIEASPGLHTMRDLPSPSCCL